MAGVMGEENKLLDRDKFNALQNQAYTFSSTVERQSPKLLDLGSNPRGYAKKFLGNILFKCMIYSSLMTINKKNIRHRHQGEEAMNSLPNMIAANREAILYIIFLKFQ